MNTVKTTMLLAGLTALFIFVGGALGGRQGMIIAFGIALVINLASYWYSDTIVLKLYRAKRVTREEAPGLHEMVERLAEKADMPVPRIYVVPSRTPNAFATGRNPSHSVVAVTSGIMNILNRDELEGVIAHELSHIKNRDTLISTVSASIAGAIMLLARLAYFAAIFGGYRDKDSNPVVLLIMMIVAPIAALIIRMAISRSREYQADASGAVLAGNPDGLAGALRKLESASRHVPMREAKSNTSHMFIVNPLSGGGITSLFRSHPSTEKRIERLMELK